ncbi:MAG TPA: hypothetical protein VGI22_00925 [Xanthobacteraceae bacterium]|jgi:hypothetical protein
MNTPSGKAFDPFDLSPYAPRRARERSAPERSALDPAAIASDDRIDSDDSESRQESSGTADPMPYAPRAALRPQAADERPADPDGATLAQSRLRPASSAERVSENATAAAPNADVDLARLEASLQWLQREESAARLPRAVPLPPVSGLRPVSPEAPRARSEQFINGVRVPPSLAPERLRLPPPMRERRDHLRGALHVLLAVAVAAPVAYYFSVGNSAPASGPAPKSALAAFAARLVASSEFPFSKEKLRSGEADVYNTVVSSRNKLVVASNNATVPSLSPAPVEMPAAAPKPAPEPAPVAPAVLPAAPEAPAVPVVQATRQLDPEAIKLLTQQGEQFVAAGDLVSARLVYLKAAEAGNAAAALALGATYDPVVLAKIGVRGMGADVEKARTWYEKAKAFGSPDAPRRLEMLANK